MAESLTRRQVADMLGVSIATVRRLEGRTLHPSVGPGDVRYFARDEVEAVAFSMRGAAGSVSGALGPAPSANPRPGPGSTAASIGPDLSGGVAAEVFSDLDRGASPAAIVVSRRLPPDIVRRLHREWTDLRALAANVPDGAQRLGAVEQQVADLTALVRTLSELIEERLTPGARSVAAFGPSAAERLYLELVGGGAQ
jgi:hypothetical protein